MSVTQVTVTGTFTAPDGSAATGTVSFALSSPLIQSGVVVVPAQVITANIEAGNLTNSTGGALSLAATNDPATTPVGVTYAVTVAVKGAPLYQFNAILPYTAGGGTIDISALPVTSPISYYEYIPSPIGASSGNVLTYNGSSWVGGTVPGIAYSGSTGTVAGLNSLLASVAASNGPYQVTLTGLLTQQATDPPVSLPSGITLNCDSQSLSGIVSNGTQNIVQSANWGNPAAVDSYISIFGGIFTGVNASAPSVPLTFTTLAQQSGLGPTSFTLNVLNTGVGTTTYYGATPAFPAPYTDNASTWTANSSGLISLPSASYATMGAAVTGTGIPAGSFISAINGSTVTLSVTNLTNGNIGLANITSSGSAATVGGMLLCENYQIGYTGLTSTSFTGCFVVGNSSTQTFTAYPHGAVIPYNHQGSGIALQCVRPTIDNVRCVNNSAHGFAIQGNQNANAYGWKFGRLRVDSPNCFGLFVGPNATDAYLHEFTDTIVGSSPGWGGIYQGSGDLFFSGTHYVDPSGIGYAPGLIIAAGNTTYVHTVLDTITGPGIVIGNCRTFSHSSSTRNQFFGVNWVVASGSAPLGPMFQLYTLSGSSNELTIAGASTGEPWQSYVAHGAQSYLPAAPTLSGTGPYIGTIAVKNAAVFDQTGDPLNTISILHVATSVTYTGTYSTVNCSAGTIAVSMSGEPSGGFSVNDIVTDPSWNAGTSYVTWGANRDTGATATFQMQSGDTFNQVTYADWTGATTGWPIIGFKAEYAPATLDTVTVTGQTLTAVDTTHATLAFTVPASGNVYVKVKGLANVGTSGTSAILALFLHGTSTQIGLPVIAFKSSSGTADVPFDVEIPVLGGALATAGYAAGSTVQVDLAMCCSTASDNVNLLIQGNTGAASSTTGNPLIMSVIAA